MAYDVGMASSKERILERYIEILITEGERAATMDAVAAAAEVSKGGLLYHFPSKDALADALGERLLTLAHGEVRALQEAADGAARYYVRTSVYVDSPLDRALVAMARLVQQGNRAAQKTFHAVQQMWLAALEECLGDRTLARAVMLLGDGLYYDAALFARGRNAAAQDSAAVQGSAAVQDRDLPGLLELVDRLVAAERRG